MNRFRFGAVFFAMMVFGWGGGVIAQVPPNCTAETATNPDRQVLKCAFGLTIELEGTTKMEILGGILPAAPTEIDLQTGAAFIEVEPGAARPQIRTPHAIAAVRGTVYVVDVSSDKTSVFVVRGAVSVSGATDETEQVILGPGEGVDVGVTPDLTVKTWPQTRVLALLARFGR